MQIGVVVARLQVPELHEAHRRLLGYVAERSDLLVVVLGVARRVSSRNPLNVAHRTHVVREHFPDAVILSLEDQRTDDEWSFRLDSLLYHAFSGAAITIYGGRDCFMPHYKGRNKTQHVELQAFDVRGSDLRAAHCPNWTGAAYRAGIIDATNRLARCITLSVDAAVTYESSLLLVRKPDESLWRLPGGCVDVGDQGLEAAASRELREETGVVVERATWEYIANAVVADYRFERDQAAMTVLWGAELPWHASPKAGDDAAEARWMSIQDDTLRDRLVPEHQPLIDRVVQWHGFRAERRHGQPAFAD